MNKVLLTGRLTRDPELRSLSSGKQVAQFVVSTEGSDFVGEQPEFHNIVAWF